MSFIDLGGGGGDSGAGGKSTPTGSSGGGFDPSAGYTGPSGQDYMGTGLPSTDVGTSPYLGDPNAAAQGYQGAYNTPQQDPNVTVPESQAPAPGTTPTSIGGVPSDQPAGGRAQAQIGPSWIQQLLRSLGVGQDGRGGALSPTLGQVSQQDAAQGYTSGTGQDFMSGTQAAADTGAPQEPDPLDQSGLTRLAATTSPGQPAPFEGQPVPTSPGQPSPEEAQAITGPSGAFGGGSPTQQAQQGTAAPQGTGYGGGSPTQAQDQPPAQQDPTAPKVPGPPDPKTTTPAPPAAPASTGPVSSRGTYDPNQAQQGQQQNPFQQFLRGLFDVLTGNMRDLQQLAKEQQPGYDWRTDVGRPGDPWYGKPMTAGYEDPLRQPRTAGGQPPGGQPPAGQPKLTDEQQQQQTRQQDLGKPGTYTIDDKGNRVLTKTDADGKPMFDQTGNPIPAETAAPPTGQPSPAQGGLPPDTTNFSQQAAANGMRTHGQFAPGDVRGMVIHHTNGNPDANGVTRYWGQSGKGLGSQFFVDRNGKVYQLAPDGARTWHAGPYNAHYEGVEVSAKNDRDVTPAQQQAVANLVAARGAKWGYNPTAPGSIYGHGEIAHGDKEADEGRTIANGIRNGTLRANYAPQAGPDVPSQGVDQRYAQADAVDRRGQSGTRGDRNNNPGNIKGGPYPGQTGRDGQGHAVFSNWGEGRRAHASLLRRLYNNQTIPQMSQRYTETNKAGWANTVMKETGFGPNQRLDLNDPETMDRLQRAIWRAEGTHAPAAIGAPANVRPPEVAPAPRYRGYDLLQRGPEARRDGGPPIQLASAEQGLPPQGGSLGNPRVIPPPYNNPNRRANPDEIGDTGPDRTRTLPTGKPDWQEYRSLPGSPYGTPYDYGIPDAVID